MVMVKPTPDQMKALSGLAAIKPITVTAKRGKREYRREYDLGEGYEVVESYDREALCYKKLILRNHRLMGAILIGEIDRAGIYTGLIRDQVDVEPFQKHLLSGNFGLISLPKAYRKHLVEGEGIEV